MTRPTDRTYLQELGSTMRAEWDRRVDHDYRFWMSDGVASDRQMWEAGERDFALIVGDYPCQRAQSDTVLELGCGVGRLLRAASSQFAHVIGIDVSEAAVTQARRLLSDRRNVRVFLGNGIDLGQVESESVHFAYSFAALSSMPVRVIAGYLLELSRVLVPSGILRLQVYLGNEICSSDADTIAIRSFTTERFRRAAEQCGLTLEDTTELVLPFEVSDRDTGMIATLVTLRRKDSLAVSTADQVAATLAALPETHMTAEWGGSETEYLLALARARQHLEASELDEAEICLRYARDSIRSPDKLYPELSAQLVAARKAVSQIPDRLKPATTLESAGSVWANNLRVLRDRFPKVADSLETVTVIDSVKVERSPTGYPVICIDGMPLDNRHDPVDAGKQIIRRNEPGRKESSGTALVYGFAGGYHLEALLSPWSQRIAVFEPSAVTLRVALESRDMRHVLQRIDLLSLEAGELHSALNERGVTDDLWAVVHPQTQALYHDACAELMRLRLSEAAFRDLRPSITVCGPVYGGSLPIAGYVSDALQKLQQRARFIDFSSFYPSYSKVQDYLKDPQRASAVQSQYVETMSSLVLEAVTEYPTDIVLCLAQAPMSARVLAELRQRGILTVMWFVEDGRRFQTWRHLARYYDYMFVIQKDGFPAMVESAGAGKALYLPVGCDPSIHQPLSVSEAERARWGSEVSFVGAGYNNRQQMFASLAHLNFKIWGTEWPAGMPFDRLVQEDGRRIDPSDYVKIFCSSAINLNLHSSTERDGVEPDGDFINPRTFELAASGAFQLTDRRRYLPECFEVGEEVVTFDHLRDLEDKIDHYLRHPEERQQIAARARQRALREHTYEHRIEQMLRFIYADRYEQLRVRSRDFGWQRVLQRAQRHPELYQRLKRACDAGEPANLENLYRGITTGQGKLSETEQRLLFLHHVRHLVSYVQRMRSGGA